MKVMMCVWIAALTIAYSVSGRSLELALLSGKVIFIGFVLGFVGAKLAVALQALRDSKLKHALSNRRR